MSGQKGKKVKAKEPVRRGGMKVWVPAGARVNLRPDKNDPPTTGYDSVIGSDWLGRVTGRREG
jgi:hypothetical protein